jgi:N-acetylglucosaminyl-diphospho-decaprenol L-rhamnosyltransferase
MAHPCLSDVFAIAGRGNNKKIQHYSRLSSLKLQHGPISSIYYGLMNVPDLEVIVVTYNSAEVIVDLLDSLPAALDGLTANVVIVDNGSTDNTADIVAARGGCCLVRSANVGYAGGINRGMREASSAEAILVLNPDVRLHKGSVRPLFDALREPGVGIAVPQVRSSDGALEFSLRREPRLSRAIGLNRTRVAALSEYIADDENYNSPRDVDWAMGAVMLVSRKCYDLLGGWDESFFLYSEETDFCLRARDAGLLTRYEPKSVVVHIGGQSGQTSKTHAMRVINRVRLYRRRHSVFLSWCYYWLIVASELSWVIRKHRESRHSIMALLIPSRRPRELACSERFMPW